MWKAGDKYRKEHGIQLEYDPRLETKETKQMEQSLRSSSSSLSRIAGAKDTASSPALESAQENTSNDRNKYGTSQNNSNKSAQAQSRTEQDHDDNKLPKSGYVSTKYSEKPTEAIRTGSKRSQPTSLQPLTRTDSLSQSAVDLLSQANMKTKSYVNPLLLIGDHEEPLATDPGQDQGGALLDAKRRHSPLRPSELGENNKESSLEHCRLINSVKISGKSQHEEMKEENFDNCKMQSSAEGNTKNNTSDAKDMNSSLIRGISTKLRLGLQ
ncbi:hypothetical protein RFI_02237 [Reticulomyxa filosa]|uniref:Uncharacterized protein n=1 Tax=Reticulomyxa filosa TaxID=46433 RepID=X6P9V2_RETFI|nr:hypothetical protein RFI_02237 [Reticulomyxa filosa]|eukprot:ETO34849.1 hypothetical protein RFI_02237 [Reticulomyxa filosa]